MSIVEILQNNPEGFSRRISDGAMKPLSSGYMVAVTDIVLSHLREATEVRRALVKASKLLNVGQESLFLGGWKDSLTGKYYLDLSVWVEDMETALAIGWVFNQKAIFDIQGLDSIEVQERRVAA